jgi:hypothetical protein
MLNTPLCGRDSVTLPLPPPRPYRLSSVSVHPKTGVVTWNPPLPPEEAERRLIMARRLRDIESSSPWYGGRAKKSLERGEHPDQFWLGRYLSCVNLDLPPTNASADETAYPTVKEQIWLDGSVPLDPSASTDPPPRLR